MAQDSLSVMVRSLSSLQIHGWTNINTFTCEQTYQSNDFRKIQLYREGEEIVFQDAELVIPVVDFDCGHKIMTKDFQEILEAESNPFLRILLHSLTGHGERQIADVSIRIAGRSRRYKMPVEIIQGNEMSMSGSGQRDVRFSEFNLEPPVKFMGMVKVKDELRISFNIRILEIR